MGPMYDVAAAMPMLPSGIGLTALIEPIAHIAIMNRKNAFFSLLFYYLEHHPDLRDHVIILEHCCSDIVTGTLIVLQLFHP